ncbi:MAG TPA: hypothetical protein VGZ27_07045 [Vicinamibacterales bacterium]|jgi:hypothetical protein|nr:hypothetical protein [Vicinamibacterales bacterium]
MSRQLFLALVALVLALGVPANAGPSSPGPSPSVPSPDPTVERHHYSIKARIRPLLVFWISRSGVGEAVVTKRQGPDEAGYSLLIGSDPDRAPRRINRWGYISEDVRGSEATLIGLMTKSDEDSIQQAEANVRKQAVGDRTFKIIRGTIDAGEAKSVVTSIAAPADYSYRQVDTLLKLAERASSKDVEAAVRVTRLPAGTNPGFLTAVAALMHRHVDQWHASGRVQPGGPIDYVYYGRIYELRATRTRALPSTQVGGRAYAHVIASDFETRSTYDGEVTGFSITYGTEGPLAEIPIAMSYQPRWWMEIGLSLDDTTSGDTLSGSALSGGSNP